MSEDEEDLAALEKRLERRDGYERRQGYHDLNDRLQRFYKRMIFAFALFGFTMAITAGYTYIKSEDNQTGLCALRGDAERRIAQSQDFLKENPKGIPGISREQLQRSTDNAVRTREALKDLNCEEGVSVP